MGGRNEFTKIYLFNAIRIVPFVTKLLHLFSKEDLENLIEKSCDKD
jgi:hypothetical protein